MVDLRPDLKSETNENQILQLAPFWSCDYL
jgi:hypothetical protein